MVHKNQMQGGGQDFGHQQQCQRKEQHQTQVDQSFSCLRFEEEREREREREIDGYLPAEPGA